MSVPAAKERGRGPIQRFAIAYSARDGLTDCATLRETFVNPAVAVRSTSSTTAMT